MHANIHPVFHPMYLQLASTKSVQSNLKATLGNVLTPSDYGVDRILAHRIVNGKTEYLVQWEGCSYLQSTYEPECNLSYAQTKLSAYQSKRRKIVTDVASVMCDDPWRNGTAVAVDYRRVNELLHTENGQVVHAVIPKPQQCPLDPPRNRLAVDYRRVNELLRSSVDEFNHSE
jgi:hypothetical protein